MRFDLATDISVDLEYAKVNLEQSAERARNNLMHPSARLDKLAAFHEAERFLDAKGALTPGHWIAAEVIANSLAGVRLTPEEAAKVIVAEHAEWQRKATQITVIVRSTELRLKAAKTPREVYDIVNRVVWPKAGELP